MGLAFAVARRLGQSLLVIAGVCVVVFIVTHLVGDPARLMLPLNATDEQYQLLRERLGLNDPLTVQFGDYFGAVLRGDFGVSFTQDEPALGLALGAVGPTLLLGFCAVALGTITGIPAGFVAALNAGKPIDRLLSATSILGVSVANFWLALLLILVFAVELQVLPTSGYGLSNLVLPTLAAAAYPFGQLMQISRSALLEELGRPYVVAARAKGLSSREIIVSHAARNALIPVVTMVGFEFGRMMAGMLIVIEIIFSWPGIGNLSYQALTAHDFPLIQACIVVIAVLVVGTNLLVDLLYVAINPRMRSAT